MRETPWQHTLAALGKLGTVQVNWLRGRPYDFGIALRRGRQASVPVPLSNSRPRANDVRFFQPQLHGASGEEQS